MPRHDQDNPIKDAIRARGVRNIDLARMAGCSPARMSACLGSGRLGYGRLRRVVLEAAGWDERAPPGRPPGPRPSPPAIRAPRWPAAVPSRTTWPAPPARGRHPPALRACSGPSGALVAVAVLLYARPGAQERPPATLPAPVEPVASEHAEPAPAPAGNAVQAAPPIIPPTAASGNATP